MRADQRVIGWFTYDLSNATNTTRIKVDLIGRFGGDGAIDTLTNDVIS